MLRLPRIVLAESSTLLRDLVAGAIDDCGRFELVGVAEGGDEANAACKRLKPDLLITGIDLGSLDGIDLAALTLQAAPQLRVLVFSHLKDIFTLNRIAEAGVHGFVPTDQPWEILEEAMVEVASGKTYFTAEVRQKMRTDPSGLSRRERQILHYVAAGWTSRAAAEKLGLSPRSVETYRYRIMKKLGVGNLAGLIDYALRTGSARPVGAGAETAGAAYG